MDIITGDRGTDRAQYPGVNEVAVIGIPDEKLGERPLALVVQDADHASRLREADIKAHVETFAIRGAISKYGIPEKVQFVDRLAKTSVQDRQEGAA
jgi:fatty-acyl-CoA synthase